jgi:hypothetical protein
MEKRADKFKKALEKIKSIYSPQCDAFCIAQQALEGDE